MKLHPNAKINIGLNVIERRADGYHNLETVFYPIYGLHDSIEVEKCEGLEVERLKDETRLPNIHFQSKGLQLDCTAEDNLIVRAARMLLPANESVSIQFEKHIPFGAGLGGGSSDAAHTVLAINELFSLGLSPKDMQEKVSRLGADCAFFIENTPCLATGIGEILTPISLSLKGYCLVLIKPNEFVSTKAAYAGITPRQPKRPLSELIQLPVHEWKNVIHNDFEDSVFPAFPAIARVKDALYGLGATYAAMSGSGASVFGLFTTAEFPTREVLEKEFAECFIHTEILH